MAPFDERLPDEQSPHPSLHSEIAALREPTRLLKHVLDVLEALIVVLDRNGHVVFFNRAAERTSGYDRGEVKGQPLIDLLVAPNEQEEAQSTQETLLAEPTTLTVEGTWVVENGERRCIRWSAESVENEAGNVDHIIGTGIDVTRQRKLQQEAVGVDEALRRQFGQELHDSLASHLCGAALMGAALTRKEARGEMAGAEALQTLTDLIREGAEQVRLLSHSFIAPDLETEDLAGALRHLADQTETTSGVACSCSVSDTAMGHMPAGKTAPHLYRIAQEAVSNAVTHGEPNHIKLTLTLEREPLEQEPPDGKTLVLEIRDDGTGVPEHAPEGVGLRNMRHRADIVDASLRIKQAETGGTVVRCTVPLSTSFPE